MTGLLTFHQCHNYGAVLQAYALQQALKKMGVASEYIDIENEVFEEHGKKAGHNLYRNPLEKGHPRKDHVEAMLQKRWEQFESFRAAKLTCSRRVENEEQLAELVIKYQMLLVGGDQLWNANLPVALDVFSVPFRCSLPKASYGTSMGDSDLISVRKRLFLKNFFAIGVREARSIPYMKKYVGDRVHSNVDPIFLLDKQEWCCCAEEIFSKQYIFAYVFNNGKLDFGEQIQKLREYAKHKRHKVIVCANDYVEEDDYVKSVIAVSPGQWLGYIKDADYVVTNSFHGLAFSILFNKPFSLLDRDVRKQELMQVRHRLTEAISESKTYLREICEYGLRYGQ